MPVDDNIEDIRLRAIELLREDYPKIKAGMLRLEVFMQARSKKAVYELRDFLDHLAELFKEGVELEDAEKHLRECRTHLRRCSVEPLEYMAEKRFIKLDRYAKWFARIPFVFRDNPLRNPEFFQQMREAKQLIADGRIVKTDGQARECMDKAFAIVTDLLAQASPARYLAQGICWLIGTFIAGVVAAIATVFIMGLVGKA